MAIITGKGRPAQLSLHKQTLQKPPLSSIATQPVFIFPRFPLEAKIPFLLLVNYPQRMSLNSIACKPPQI